MRRVATTLAAVLALGALGPAITSAAAAAATTPRAVLTDIENDVMCPSCHEPLAVAAVPAGLRRAQLHPRR